MMKTKLNSKGILQLFAFIALSALLSNCKKDVVNPGNKITMDTTGRSFAAKTRLASTNSYDLTNSLPSDYVTDGTVDYTKAIQTALNNHTDVTFPAFPLLVNDAGIIVRSNANLTFLKGSQLILKPSASTNYTILRVLNASNVTITNPVIVGDRYTHLATSGEWGQGLGIYASSNVTVTGANITNCWGDGIYLASKNRVGNYNIHISKSYCKSNRRNGISVTNVVGLVLDSAYAGYCDGTAPFTGIDFEAGSYYDNLQDITINNAKTSRNLGNGISIGFRNLFGGPNKIIGFTINNPVDKGSAVAFKTSASLTHRVGSETVTGNINIVNPSWRLNSLSPIQTNLFVTTIKLSISNPSIDDVNGLGLSQDEIVSLLTYKTNINSGANYSITF